MKVLLDLLTKFSNHAKKETETLPPLMEALSKEQLKSIEETAKQLGYAV